MTLPGDVLRAWRARAGLTQAKAAALMSVPLRTYEHYERGRVPLNFWRAVQWVAAQGPDAGVPVE